MGRYMDEITRSMDYLASHDNTVFLGQAVAVAGTAMRNTLLNVKEKKLIELPVEEEFQLGLSIGLSLNRRIPICIFPRWNFLLLATNQIVNHLDKLKEFTIQNNFLTGFVSEFMCDLLLDVLSSDCWGSPSQVDCVS